MIKHTTIRKQIAEHMVVSKHTSPHVLTVMEADMSRVVKHRAANKDIFARDGVNLTYTAYFMMAIVAGLKAYPNVNSSWSDDGLLIHKAVNIGMATSLGEEGLIVPVIKAKQIELGNFAARYPGEDDEPPTDEECRNIAGLATVLKTMKGKKFAELGTAIETREMSFHQKGNHPTCTPEGICGVNYRVNGLIGRRGAPKRSPSVWPAESSCSPFL